MAKKIVDFIKGLIVKAGGNLEDEKIKAALSQFNIEAELHDDAISAIENGLISIGNAKNNHPEIKNHYFAAAYNGLDNELNVVMQDEKLSEDIINELKSEKSSTKRAALLVKKIKEIELQKNASGKDATKALNDQIAALNEQLRIEKEGIQGIKNDYEKRLREKDKGFAMRNLLSGYQTVHDKMDAETKGIIINAIIDKNLRSRNYILDIDENQNLTLKTKDGGGAFSEDNRPLTPKMFLDKVMADENLLVVTDNNNKNNGNNNQNNNSGQFNNQNRQQSQNNGQFNNQNRQQGSNNNGNQNNNGNARKTVLQDLIKQSQEALTNASTQTGF